MDYLIRLVQQHEDFRLAETRSLASIYSIEIQILSYSADSPFLILRIISHPRFPTPESAAAALISRSVLSWAIYELWGSSVTTTTSERESEQEPGNDCQHHDGASGSSGSGSDCDWDYYGPLHADVKTRTNQQMWSRYREGSFKFSVDAYCGKRSQTEQKHIINGFRFLDFQGPIRMENPDFEFTVFEEWSLTENPHHQSRQRTCNTDSIDSTLESGPGPLSQPQPQPQPQPHPSDRDGRSDHIFRCSRKKNQPHRLLLGRLLCSSPRGALVAKHSLKSRPYIATTSMDATLALVSANLARSEPGKLVYDPFVGTGGFLLAAAEFGACVWGSDIDGRSFRGVGGGGSEKGRKRRMKAGGDGSGGGKGCENGVGKNFKAYELDALFGDCFVSDLTNSPLRWRGTAVAALADHGQDSAIEERGGGKGSGWLDGIICDPPYGVREGLKVLGSRNHNHNQNHDSRPFDPSQHPLMIDGVPAHTLPGYVAPKQPYSFECMLQDILTFAAETLVRDGRLAFWMPCPNQDTEDQEHCHDNGDGDDNGDHDGDTVGGGKGEGIPEIPQHPELELLECCVQRFRNWSRRLLVYRRRAPDESSCLDVDNTDDSCGRRDRRDGDIDGAHDGTAFPRSAAAASDSSTPATPRGASTSTASAVDGSRTGEGQEQGQSQMGVEGESAKKPASASDLNAFRRMYFQGFRK